MLGDIYFSRGSGRPIAFSDQRRRPPCVICHQPFTGTPVQKMCNPCRETPEGKAHNLHMRNRSEEKNRRKRKAAARG